MMYKCTIILLNIFKRFVFSMNQYFIIYLYMYCAINAFNHVLVIFYFDSSSFVNKTKFCQLVYVLCLCFLTWLSNKCTCSDLSYAHVSQCVGHEIWCEKQLFSCFFYKKMVYYCIIFHSCEYFNFSKVG